MECRADTFHLNHMSCSIVTMLATIVSIRASKTRGWVYKSMAITISWLSSPMEEKTLDFSAPHMSATLWHDDTNSSRPLAEKEGGRVQDDHICSCYSASVRSSSHDSVLAKWLVISRRIASAACDRSSRCTCSISMGNYSTRCSVTVTVTVNIFCRTTFRCS